MDPARRARVDDLGLRVFEQGEGLGGRVVGQAEHAQIRTVEKLGPRLPIPAMLRWNEQHLHILAPGEHLANPQPGRPLLAIYVNRRFLHGKLLLARTAQFQLLDPL